VQPRSSSVALAAAASVLENGIYTLRQLAHMPARASSESVDTPTCRTKKIASMPSELAGAMSEAPSPHPLGPAGYRLQGQTAGRSYSTLARPTGSACGHAVYGKLARLNLAHPTVPSQSRSAPANCSAAAAKLGRSLAGRFFEVLTAAWRRPWAARC